MYSKSPVYTFCKRDKKSIGHLFYECTILKELWFVVEAWILRQFDLLITCDKKSVLFGKKKDRDIYRFVLT